MVLWAILGFLVGFAIIAASFRELLFDREIWARAWLLCIAGGLFIAAFELVVGVYA